MLRLIVVKKPFKSEGFDIYIQNVAYRSTDKRLKLNLCIL